MALRPYFTTFYLTEIDIPEGQRVQDHLHPEWANLRLFQGSVPEAEIAGAQGPPGIAAIGTGPTSTTVRFTAGRCRMWGIGLLPLGWAKFARAPAHLWADRIFDPVAEADFAQFAPLIDGVFGAGADEAAELERITAFFAARADMPVPDEDRIVAIHGAIVDPETGTVADLAEATGLASYTIERICRRYFGFAPRLLLRRQRFMRSLSQYMLDPELKWIGAIDGHYHDQAQFVRDFRRFMGMTPRAYVAHPRPVLSAVMRARFEAAGAAVQALHLPARTGD